MTRVCLAIGIFLLAFGNLTKAYAEVVFVVDVAPPPLVVYEQPPLPGPDYLWTPGYWAWDVSDTDYYWVPGAWVLAPEPGLLWTPGYWAWRDGRYGWYDGYWGPQVGFYGGVVYGFGYTGFGFYGGGWRGNTFYYNKTVTNVNVTVVKNVYNQPVTINKVTKVSFNGGPNGLKSQPTAEQKQAFQERKAGLLAPQQKQHLQLARQDKALRFNANNGAPKVAALQRAGSFDGKAVKAKGVRTTTPSVALDGAKAKKAGQAGEIRTKNVAKRQAPFRDTNRVVRAERLNRPKQTNMRRPPSRAKVPIRKGPPPRPKPRPQPRSERVPR